MENKVIMKHFAQMQAEKQTWCFSASNAA